MPTKYDAVLFDLLTALLDSWSLWNDVAVDPETGMACRKAYLEVTYGCGAYRPYEDLVAEAAEMAGIAPVRAAALVDRWDELTPWPDAVPVLQALHGRVKLGVVTNCSVVLGHEAARASVSASMSLRRRRRRGSTSLGGRPTPTR